MGLHLRAPCMIPRLLTQSQPSGSTGTDITLSFTGYHLTGLTAIWLATQQGTSLSVTNDGAATCSMHVPNIAPGSYTVQGYHPRTGAYPVNMPTSFTINA